jgi:hypothetical protein
MPLRFLQQPFYASIASRGTATYRLVSGRCGLVCEIICEMRPRLFVTLELWCRDTQISVARSGPAARSRYGSCSVHWPGQGTGTSQTSKRQEGGKPMDHPHDQHLKLCDECEQPATWVRRTQFAGNHYFCTMHAQREEDFGQDDLSYFFWELLTRSLTRPESLCSGCSRGRQPPDCCPHSCRLCGRAPQDQLSKSRRVCMAAR